MSIVYSKLFNICILSLLHIFHRKIKGRLTPSFKLFSLAYYFADSEECKDCIEKFIEPIRNLLENSLEGCYEIILLLIAPDVIKFVVVIGDVFIVFLAACASAAAGEDTCAFAAAENAVKLTVLACILTAGCEITHIKVGTVNTACAGSFCFVSVLATGFSSCCNAC